MKKILFLSILFFSCFVFQVQSQVTVTVGTGTEEGRYNPIYTFYGYNYTQQIYTSAELNTAGAVAGMQINAIRFYWTGAGTLNNADVWTVYIGETTQSSFTSTTNWVPFASLTEVYTGTITLPATAGWFTITLTTPVVWNGGNIVVAIDENVPGYGPSTTRWQATITTSNTVIYYYNDNTNPDPSTPPSGTTTTTRPNIQFEMMSLTPCAGNPDPGTATPASQLVPIGGSANLTLSGSTVAAGLSYQWQRATSPTGPFTDITGATSLSYNTGALTTSYYYRCIVTCVATGDADTSTIAFVEVVQSYNMSNTTITTCDALFYDSGGPTGTYSANQNLTLTIMPDIVGGNVIVTFNSFTLENNYDKLFIYNGNSITAPLIGQYTGSTSPGTVTSTAADGSLTFRFTSDGSVQYAGWEAVISCSDPCNYVYETPTFDQVGPFCSGWTIPDLPTTSNNGYEGTWAPAIDNTATTTYTFTPNEGECATPTTMTIVVNPNNPASFTQYSSYCRGDSIPELPTISNDGIEGTWSPAINNWNTTEYTFVTNDGTCAWTTMEIEIDTVPAEIINNSGSNELNCDLTAIYLTAEGGVSYSWDGVYFNTFQGKTITDPGTYTVIVRDANSCTGEASIEITQNLNPPVATITNNTGSDYLNCHINEISLTASGGATYTWNGGSSPNSATNTFNTEGTYYVTVTADNGCDTIIYYMITDETILDITENITSPSCFGMTGSAEIIINSGGQAPFIIEWTDGVTTFSRTNIPTNTPFGYIITDADNCSTIRSLTITTPEQIQVNFVSDSVSCYGGHDGSLDISNSTGGVPPYSYQWSVAGGTGSQITGLAAGTYFVTISDAKNCTASGSHSVGQPEQISIDMQITDAICGQTGGAINAEATGGVGGFTYEWSTSSISNNITGLTPNMYTLTVTDANNCTQTASATVDKTGDIIANITVVQPILCGGNPDAILQGSSANGAMPLTFNWSNSATSEIINNLAVGTYMLTVTDAWGCTGSTEETLEAAIDVSINSNVSHVKCYGNNDGKINIGILSGEPPFTIAWSNDSTELNQSSLPAGLYSVTITDNRDCAITENFEIIEPPILELAFTKKDVSCYSDLNGTITMNVTGGTEPYTYSITTPRNQVVTNTASANNLSIGKYIMKVVDNNGCTDIKETNIYQPAKLSAKVNVTNPSCMGNDDGSIIVTPFGGTSPYRYTYDNFDLDTNIIVNAKEGRYSIEVEDANSCKLILSDIYVGDGLLPCLKIPNAFTPNGDGINETWIIENIDLYPDAQIFVYTRWGEQIYYGTPKSDPWNGTYNGKKMPTGAYLYIVETRNNDAGVYKGTVTIVY
jgi:gliding motility-associated-like protein